MALLATSDRETATARVVAVEPDPRSARALAALFDGHEQLAIDVVATIDDAIAAIEQRVPDLIMTTVLLHPGEEADLITRLKRMPSARHVPVVHIPAGVTEAVAAQQDHTSPRFSVFRRRTSTRHGCDVDELQAQMLTYIREARTARTTPILQVPDSHALVVVPETTALVPSRAGALEAADAFRNGRERRRARRRRREEMPWLWAVKLPWGGDVRVVDMSSTGMLVETAAHLDTGGTVALKMIGEQANLVVPAHTVRSEAAWMETGVLYRVGFEFAEELDTFGRYPLSVAAALRPRTLTDLLTRVMDDAERGIDPANVRTRFTQELLELIPARDIRFRHSSTDDGNEESVQFTVPNGGSAGLALQVAFEPGYSPSMLEFRFLQAAAAAAGIVAAYCPVGEDK